MLTPLTSSVLGTGEPPISVKVTTLESLEATETIVPAGRAQDVLVRIIPSWVRISDLSAGASSVRTLLG